MKITHIEVVTCKNPIKLQEPWIQAWTEPNGPVIESLGYSFYKMHTDAGITGIGHHTGGDPDLAKDIDPDLVKGFDPFMVRSFWERYMSGNRESQFHNKMAGFEIAMWDIIGKSCNQPVHKLLGAQGTKKLVYAATARILDEDEQVKQALDIQKKGFKAIKLRMHREDPWEDLKVVAAVRKALGDKFMILTDANQNNFSEGYNYWSKRTALKITRELEKLDVYYIEDPLRNRDIDELVELRKSVNIPISGGEHIFDAYGFKEYIIQHAYSIIQPDITLGGNLGIIGLKKVAELAETFNVTVIPHVYSYGALPLTLYPTLQVMATINNCPMVEYPYDPPILTEQTTQSFVKDPILLDHDGCMKIPDKPGIGVELDEEILLQKTISEFL